MLVLCVGVVCCLCGLVGLLWSVVCLCVGLCVCVSQAVCVCVCVSVAVGVGVGVGEACVVCPVAVGLATV